MDANIGKATTRDTIPVTTQRTTLAIAFVADE